MTKSELEGSQQQCCIAIMVGHSYDSKSGGKISWASSEYEGNRLREWHPEIQGRDCPHQFRIVGKNKRIHQCAYTYLYQERTVEPRRQLMLFIWNKGATRGANLATINERDRMRSERICMSIALGLLGDKICLVKMNSHD